MKRGIMYQEEQWKPIGNCPHCGCPIYKMDEKIKWTGNHCHCQCELEREVDSQEDSNDLPRYH